MLTPGQREKNGHANGLNWWENELPLHLDCRVIIFPSSSHPSRHRWSFLCSIQ